MNFTKYTLGIFVFAGIISLIAGSGGNYFTSANAQTLGEKIGNSIGGALDEAGEGISNVSKGASQAANNTASEMGQAGQNATEAMSGAANETSQAADNATSSSNSSNPLEMLMNLFKGNK
ncbi:MAG TPA: hypothetical protein VJP58_07115 [Candidatus Nitrosocosmicus sp.]|nr:hypothetical protein [Candidatus Nitrosocosmicus sp.]